MLPRTLSEHPLLMPQLCGKYNFFFYLQNKLFICHTHLAIVCNNVSHTAHKRCSGALFSGTPPAIPKKKLTIPVRQMLMRTFMFVKSLTPAPASHYMWPCPTLRLSHILPHPSIALVPDVCWSLGFLGSTA
jgi:hypothetical protein